MNFKKKKSEEWIKIFDKAGLPCGPINSITDMHKDNHTLYRKMIIEVENKIAGKSKAIGMPIKFSETNDEQSKVAPVFGQHTDIILKDFGYTSKQIEEFKSRGIIA